MAWWWAAAWGGWVVAPEARLVEEVVAESTLGPLELHDGWLFDVMDGDEPVGVVFVGEGTYTVQVPDRVDALAVANQLVVVGRADPATVAPLAREGRLPTPIDRGWFLGPDAHAELTEGLMVAHEEGGVAITHDAEGRTHVVVTQSVSLPAARRRAERLLRERLTHHDHLGTRLDALVAADITQAAASPRAPAPRWAEVRTTLDWGAVVGARRQPWLALTRQQGAVAGASGAVLVRHPEDPTVPPRVLASAGSRGPRARVLGAAATVELAPDATQQAAWQRHTVHLEIAAEGGSLGVVRLSIPRARTLPFGGAPETANRFELGSVRVDGVPVEVWALEEHADHAVIAVPVTLAAGEHTRVAVGWQDRQRYAHAIEVGVGSPSGSSSNVVPVGTSTDLVQVFPTVTGPRVVQGPLPAAVRVGVPAAGEVHRAVQSGEEPIEVLHHGVRWTTTTASYPHASTAMGRWDTQAARGDGPHVYLRTEPHGSVAQATRQLGILQQRAFGLPAPEHLVVSELHAEVGRFDAAAAPGGLVAFHPYAAPPFHQDRTEPYEAVADSLSTWVLGYGLYGQRLPTSAPAARALSVAAATLTLQGASGRSAAEPWWQLLHMTAEPWRRHVVDDWGAGFTLGRSLPTLVGHDRVADALGAIARGDHPATWTGVRDALEDATGADLTGVVAVHLAGGLIPDVDAQVQDGQVIVTTNVPFGQWHLPVRVTGGSEEVWGLVHIVDGVGVATLDWPGEAPPRRVVVDPHRDWLLERPAVVLERRQDTDAWFVEVSQERRTPEGLWTNLEEVRPHDLARRQPGSPQEPDG